MIAHLVAFTFKPEVTDEQISGLTAALTALGAELPSVKAYLAGPNLHLRPQGADYGVLAVVEDQAGLDAYLDSPQHKQAFTDYLGPMTQSRSAVQIPFSADVFAALTG
ncbi:Dabb family protein [Nakamurella flava]|uniref:Dabb family protein n=1 Tax=Nakamurella flava TaxID=2576308 RepID=A0A4U6QKR5_9ACTN|nr:Dabb family protein [Nakamurella flava]TKV61084.1 Dabb family protein [Nakamurella flava]